MKKKEYKCEGEYGKHLYSGDSRYEKIWEQMELLGIQDVSTFRQEKNGTIVWRLPIKYSTHPKFIEVASFATGYVRNQNGGYTNYQLNKRVDKEGYHPEYKMEQGHCVKTGKFYKYNTRSCKLIPREIDRLEYLIGYCLKNYYIKKANEVINGDFIPKWTHKYELEKAQEKMEEICHIDANHMFFVNELENKLANSVPKWKYDEAMKLGHESDTVIGGLEKELSVYKGDVVPEWKYTDAKTNYMMLQAKLDKTREQNESVIKELESSNYKFSQKIKDQAKAIKVYEAKVYNQDYVYDRIRDLENTIEGLENQLSNAISVTKYECAKARTERASDRIYELENKLKTISRRLDVTKSIADNE